jgi:hypothetical protein
MSGKTFVEKIFGADAGSIVFKKPDIVLSHDNTVSIEKTFKKMEVLMLPILISFLLCLNI